MTKEEFIQQYCEGSRWTPETFAKYRVALPCYCGDEICNGWAAIPNNSFDIDWHMQRDGQPPKGEI